MRICSIGECMIEISHNIQNKYVFSYAGDTANTAIYLSRLGAHSAYITSIGNDRLSKKMISFFNKENVFTDDIHINKNNSLGLYLIINDDNGEKNFFYWRNNSAAKNLF
jgi:Sugar kinases, ribokinase family